MARLLRYLGLLGLLPVALCRIGYDLRPTQTNFATDQFDFEWGWTPMPTTAPRVLGGLQRRQQNAPDATCGFIDGVAESSLTCSDAYCGFNSDANAAGCCSGVTYVNGVYTETDCTFFTTCYDYTASGECDLSCQANTQVRLCDSDYPYCLTYSWTDGQNGYTGLNCDVSSGLTAYMAVTISAPSIGSTTTTSPPVTIISSSTMTAQPSTTLSTTRSTTLSTTVSTPAVVLTISSTSSNPGTSSSSITTPSSSSTSVFSTSSALGPILSTTSTTSSLSSSTSNAGDPIVVTTITVSNGPSVGTIVSTVTTPTSSNAGGSSSPQNTTPSKSSSNTGAIAGGVVGGVAILALAAFLLWFCLRRRNRRTTNTAGPPIQEISEHTSRVQSPYSGGPVSPVTQGPSQYGSPEQVHEFPAAAAGGGAAAGMYGRSHPADHPQSGYQPPGQYQYQYGPGQPVERAHEVSSEGTGSSGRPLNPNPYPNYNINPNAGYASANAPEVIQQQGGYRGLDPTGGGYNHPNANANMNASYGADPGFYGRPYGEMP